MTHAWWIALLLGAGCTLWLRRAGRRAIVFATLWFCGVLLAFIALPELAGRGWLPFATEPSICDESPGSGCAACVDSNAQVHQGPQSCYEPSIRPWVQRYASWSPLRGAAADFNCGVSPFHYWVEPTDLRRHTAKNIVISRELSWHEDCCASE